MKLKSMTTLLAKSVAVLAACVALNASADTPAAKAPVSPVEKPGALFDTIGATFDAGFDSRYYFRGLWFADNIMWSALNISVPITDKLSWGIGGAYINTAGTPLGVGGVKFKSGYNYSEVDAITSLNYNAGWAKFGMQYQYYFYPDNYAGSFKGVPTAAGDPEFGIKGAGELGWTMAVPLKAFNLYAGYYYDFRINGQYISLGADYTYAINDWLSIVPSVNTGYGIDYYTGNGSGSTSGVGQGLGLFNQQGNQSNNYPKSGFTHVLYTIAMPIKLTKIATLTPYVAMNESERLRVRLNVQRNEIYWGVKLSFAF